NRGSSRTAVALAAAWGAASLLGIQSASAQITPVNNWTGTAGDNLWVTPGNWSQNAAPFISGGHADDVFFNDGGGALNIVLPTSASAGRINGLNTSTTTFTGNSGGNGLQLR